MARLNPNWSRDELILALDLYFDIDFAHNWTKKNPKIRALSELLNSLPIHETFFRGTDFRNENGVQMKLSNFLRFDPEFRGQTLERGSKGDESIWLEFAPDRARLKLVARAIKQNSQAVSEIGLDSVLTDYDEVFSEGRILTRLHRFRERNSVLTRRKKDKILRDAGKLVCEACGFDFETVYGELGKRFAECHHTVPLSSLGPDVKTKLSDLSIVCANCHRMLHRSATWLSISDLRTLLKSEASRHRKRQ